MGNSEVGHTNLGAGRIVYQDLTRIDKSDQRRQLLRRRRRCAPPCDAARDGAHALHLLGLLSDGGVHSHQAHLHALAAAGEAARRVEGVRARASPTAATPRRRAARATSTTLEARARRVGAARIASVSGRYYAMDRDKRWERVKLAYDAIVQRHGADRGRRRQP